MSSKMKFLPSRMSGRLAGRGAGGARSFVKESVAHLEECSVNDCETKKRNGLERPNLELRKEEDSLSSRKRSRDVEPTVAHQPGCGGCDCEAKKHHDSSKRLKLNPKTEERNLPTGRRGVRDMKKDGYANTVAPQEDGTKSSCEARKRKVEDIPFNEENIFQEEGGAGSYCDANKKKVKMSKAGPAPF